MGLVLGIAAQLAEEEAALAAEASLVAAEASLVVTMVQPLLADMMIHEQELTFVVYFVKSPDAWLEALEWLAAYLVVLKQALVELVQEHFEIVAQVLHHLLAEVLPILPV